MDVTLLHRARLLRRVSIHAETSAFELEYNGKGFGYESVRIDGETKIRSFSLFWFVPHFEFSHDGHSIEVDVKVWPWLKIKGFRIHVDGHLLYSEVPF